MGERKMEDRIAINPKAHHGKPVIRGTRVPVTVVLGNLGGGMIVEEIIKDYHLAKEGIEVAVLFAIDLVEQQKRPLPAPAEIAR